MAEVGFNPSAGIAGTELFNALLTEDVAQLKGGHHGGVVVAGDLNRITDVILVTMGQDDTVAVNIFRPMFGQCIAGEKGIDTDSVCPVGKQKTGVPEKRDVDGHDLLLIAD